ESMSRSSADDCDLDTKPSDGSGTEAIAEGDNEIFSLNKVKNECDDTKRTEGFAPAAYRDFSQVANETRYLDAIQSRLRPPSKKLPTKLNAMLTDPGENPTSTEVAVVGSTAREPNWIV
ncbi:hypothetical protein ACHAXS_011657, partial [Conticribra weissflogii]